jgi:hypothetical protein
MDCHVRSPRISRLEPGECQCLSFFPPPTLSAPDAQYLPPRRTSDTLAYYLLLFTSSG